MQGRRLLVVDDEPSVLDTLKGILTYEGYEVETATSGQEALGKMEVFPAEIVLSDYMMPDMNGIKLLKKIKQCYSHIIPILLTGRGDTQISFKTINQSEIFRCLLKPWDNEELKMTLHTALQHYDLNLENERLAKAVKKQEFMLEEIEKKYPGLTEIEKEEDGTILIEDEDCSDIMNSFKIKEADYNKE